MDPSVQAALLCAAAIQYDIIGRLYSQYFIANYSNSKLQFKIYSEPILSTIVHRHQTRPDIHRGHRCSRFYFNQKDKRRTTAYNPESAHSIA